MRLSTTVALGSSPLLRPPTAPALVLRGWYDASRLTLNGSAKVSSWTDQSGSNHLTQGTPAATVLTGAVNGRPAVLFPGAASLAVAYGATRAQPWTFATVAKLSSSSQICDGIDGSNRCAIATFAAGIDMYAGSVMTGVATIATYMTIIATFNGASSNIRVSGAQVATGNPNTLGIAGLTLGSRFDGSSNLIGGIAEFLAYNTVIAGSDLVQLERYLRWKYRTW